MKLGGGTSKTHLTEKKLFEVIIIIIIIIITIVIIIIIIIKLMVRY